MSPSFRPSDFSDGTWEDRYDRDLERTGPARPARQLTPDDLAERTRMFASAAFCADLNDEDHGEPLDAELDELACRGDYEREQQQERARLEVES